MPSRGGDPRGAPLNAERVEEIIAGLDSGDVRVAEPDGDGWRVNEEAQEAILEYFRLRQMEPEEVGPFAYHDKIPLKRDYERLRERCRIVVFCPITAPTATWEMKREHIESVMEASRAAMAALLHQRGSKLFRHSGIHYLPLG